MNPYESRRLARRLHDDRARRIEKLLLRFAANGDLDGPMRPVRSPHYVWCDVHCSIHERKNDVYDEGSEFCESENWRAVFVASTDPDEEF